MVLVQHARQVLLAILFVAAKLDWSQTQIQLLAVNQNVYETPIAKVATSAKTKDVLTNRIHVIHRLVDLVQHVRQTVLEILFVGRVKNFTGMITIEQTHNNYYIDNRTKISYVQYSFTDVSQVLFLSQTP